MKKLYLVGIEKEMYETYKQSCIENNAEYLTFEQWSENGKPTLFNNVSIQKKKCNKSTSSNDTENKKCDKKSVTGYSFEEASRILGFKTSTIKSYLQYPSYGLKKINRDTLCKKSVDLFSARLKEKEEKKDYRSYALSMLDKGKVPVSHDIFRNADFKIGNEKLVDLDKYISIEDTAQLLDRAVSTVKNYVREKRFPVLIEGFDAFLLKSEVIRFSTRFEKENLIYCTHCNKELDYTDFEEYKIEDRCDKCENTRRSKERRINKELIERYKSFFNDIVYGNFIDTEIGFININSIMLITPLKNMIELKINPASKLTNCQENLFISENNSRKEFDEVNLAIKALLTVLKEQSCQVHH